MFISSLIGLPWSFSFKKHYAAKIAEEESVVLFADDLRATACVARANDRFAPDFRVVSFVIGNQGLNHALAQRVVILTRPNFLLANLFYFV